MILVAYYLPLPSPSIPFVAVCVLICSPFPFVRFSSDWTVLDGSFRCTLRLVILAFGFITPPLPYRCARPLNVVTFYLVAVVLPFLYTRCVCAFAFMADRRTRFLRKRTLRAFFDASPPPFPTHHPFTSHALPSFILVWFCMVGQVGGGMTWFRDGLVYGFSGGPG